MLDTSRHPVLARRLDGHLGAMAAPHRPRHARRQPKAGLLDHVIEELESGGKGSNCADDGQGGGLMSGVHEARVGQRDED